MSTTAPIAPSENQALQSEAGQVSVQTGESSPQLRDFRGEKFTVGSSARCDLQLAEGKVQPLHFVLAKKPDGMQLTTWATGVQLNGSPVQAAAIHPGDVVSLGDVQLEWLAAITPKPAFSGTNSFDKPVDWNANISETQDSTDAVPTKSESVTTGQSASRQAFSDCIVFEATSGLLSNRGRCRKLVESCRQSRGNAQQLATEIVQLEKRLAAASQERLAQQANVERLSTQLAESVETENRDNSQAEWELASLREQLATAQKELSEQLERNGQLQEQFASIRAELSQLTDANADEPTEQEALGEQLANQERQLDEVRQELVATRESLKATELKFVEQTRLYTELQEQLNTKSEEVASLKEQLSQAKLAGEEASALAQRCETLQSSVDESEKRIAELSELNQQRDEELVELRTSRESWLTEKSQWTAEQTAQQASLAALSEQLEVARERDQAELASSQTERAELLEQLAAAKSELEELRSSADQQLAVAAEQKQKQDAWQFEKASLESQLTEKSQLVIDLKKDLKNAAENSQSEIEQINNEQLSGERDRLAAELAMANDSLAELRKLSSQQEQQLQALQQSNAAAPEATEEEFAEVVEKLEFLTTELKGSRNRCTEAETRSAELQALLDQATEQLTQLGSQATQQLSSDFTSKAVEEPHPEVSEENTLEVAVDNSTNEAVDALRDVPTSDGGNASIETVEAETSEDAGATTEEQRTPKQDPFAARTQPAEPESTGGSQSTSFIEQYAHLLEEEGEEVEPETAPRANLLLDEEHLPASKENVEEDGDEALQAYMASMMSRVRGDGPIAAPKVTKPAVKPKPVARTKEQDTATQEEYTAPIDPISIEELRQSSNKPKLTSDLGALRDLANSSARSAIAKSSKRRHYEIAISKLIICGIALPTAGYLMYAAKSFTGLMFLGGAVTAIAGAYSGVQLLGCLLRAIRDGSWNGFEDGSKPSKRKIALPIDGVSER
ncbi:FHA domain-containing protein [Adhaeretor mobilis]|uniref:Chromosome partition protein Smc n=1 Tax=Adhaeretor mobilis TaxID=1930276 RepID=A0A517MZ39_9BACT|nr:FHA domain-containing protein [Adhaeretor mobilis]QDT00151.1 Chromosome partition protein Smc [Adhaeretor mobilis]